MKDIAEKNLMYETRYEHTAANGFHTVVEKAIYKG